MHLPAARRALAEHTPALAILVLFLGLSRLYLLATPPFEAPDEPAHYAYIRYLVDERSLPPLIVSSDPWEQGEMHQPPLYYALAALAVAADGVRPADDGVPWREAFPRNPHAALGEPGAPGNRNAVLHRGIPDRATLRALRAARSLSTGCAAATVWMTYLLARALFPRRRALALGAMGLLAANPQFLFIGASVSNDPLVTALATGALLLAARVVRGKDRPVATPLGMGLLAGLAALTKISGLAALALIPGAYGLRRLARREDRSWRALAPPLLIAGLAAASVGGWWYARNGLLYGDPLGMRTHHAIFSSQVEPLSPLATLRTAIEALPSYWGVFGWMNVLAPEAFYLGVRALTAAGVGGLLLAAWRVWRRRATLDPATFRSTGFVALWVLVMGGVALAWTQSSTRIQGRLLFPAAAAVACLLAVGISAWLPRRLHGAALGLACAALAAAAIYVPYGVIGPAYAPPSRIAMEDLPADVRPLGIRYGGGDAGSAITLLGYRAAARDAAPGDTIPLTLYWRAEGPVDTDYVEAVTLIGPGGERLGGVDTHPAMGLSPTSGWPAGEVIVDEVAVPVEVSAEWPVAASVRVGLYAGEHTATLAALDGAGSALPPAPEVGRLRVAPAVGAAPPTATHALDATFGDVATLRGYDLAAQGAGDLAVTLHWECLAEMAEPYTVMVHVIGEDGEPLAYADGPPLDGALPTDYWRAGDALCDVHRVALPGEALGQALTLRVGLYRFETFERLPATGDGAAGDHVVLGPFVVSAQGEVVLAGDS